MTQDEKNIIKSEILKELRDDSVRIEDLARTNEVTGEDLIELSGGRSISLDDLKKFIKGVGIYLELLGKNSQEIPTDNNVFSALRTLSEISKVSEESKKLFLRKDQSDVTKFLLKLLGGIVTTDVKSDNLLLGALGTGYGLLKQDSTGKSYLEIDKLFVRLKAVFSALEIMELTYSGGNYIFGPAGARCTRVEEFDTYYRCYFTADDGSKKVKNKFRVDDFVQCREDNIEEGAHENVSNKYYWRRCIGIGDGYIDLSKDDCDMISADIPTEGDNMVTIGNRTDASRQNVIIISVYGEGSPSIIQYKGIDTYSLEGKAKTIISPERNEFRGTFFFESGEDLQTRFEITEEKINSVVEGLRTDFTSIKSYLNNASFGDGMDNWDTENDTQFLLFGSKLIWANDAPLSDKTNFAAVMTDEGRTVVYIRNKYILQKNENFRIIPEYNEVNSLGMKMPDVIYLKFFYRVVKAGRLTIEFEGLDKTGFEDFDEFYYQKDINVTNGYQEFEYVGMWNGTGDFKLSFTGEIFLYMLVLSTDRAESIVFKYRTLFEQSDKLVRIAAQNFDIDGNVIDSSSIITTGKYNKLISEHFNSDGTLKNKSGLITTANFATMFSQAVDTNNLVHRSEISAFVTENEVGNIVSKIKISADQIDLTGVVTFNSLDQSMKDTINQKVNTSSLGSLAYKNQVASDLLNADLNNLINNKANSSDLGALAYKESVEAAQLGSTIIVGGYLNTDYVKVNRIDANGARIGGFTIEDGVLWWKGSDYYADDLRTLKLGVPRSYTEGIVDVRFNANTAGRFGIKTCGTNLGGAAIYASSKSSGNIFPHSNRTYAGYFEGDVHITADLYCFGELLAKNFGCALEDNNGVFSYRGGVSKTFKWSVGNVGYNLEVQGGIVVAMNNY